MSLRWILFRRPLKDLHPEVKARAEIALAWADYYGVPTTVTSGVRTCAEQATLRSAFLAGRSRFPANAPGDSAHQFGLAWDSVTQPAIEPWWTAVREWVGFRIPANDVVHAEVPSWRSFRAGAACP